MTEFFAVGLATATSLGHLLPVKVQGSEKPFLIILKPGMSGSTKAFQINW